jgi:uncharacterized protein involved in type VI secretion and phage assembly
VNVEKVVANLVQKVEHRFYGKYRGLVVDNDDREQLGRLRLQVPSVLGPNVVTGWALPCVPYGGAQNQGVLCIPEPGAGVWVEFEEGDLEFPIWVGTFWSKPGGNSELPKPNNANGSEHKSVQKPPTRKIIKTQKGHTIQFEDADGQEMLTLIEATHGHVITMNTHGIHIKGGAGQEVVLHGSGVTITDQHGNSIVMSAEGIQIGSSEAAEPFVLGQQFFLNVISFLTALNAHTHVGNLGAPTSPPVPPIPLLEVPLSTKHRVE